MDRLAAFLATFFGLGRIPLAPGTAASAVALPAGWALAIFGGWQWLTLAAIAVTVIGIWACGVHARALNVEDPGECVIDEVAGQWFALLGVVFTANVSNLVALAAAFVLFRIFDITKLWPVSRGEQLPGGHGIMMDDVIAGILSALLITIAAGLNWI